jgi:hypothetical protein
MKIKKIYENSTPKYKIGGYIISNLLHIIEIYDNETTITFDKDDIPELIKILNNVLLEDDAKKYNI